MSGPVTLLFRPERPRYFIARYGNGGWTEGFGWTEREALDDLAERMLDVSPSDLADELLEQPDRLRQALAEWAGPSVLDA